ncbi:hypothetical protein F5Y15DRAFT_399303 [Xylariaceae sp. FL0016]|nr:hypothetical protein F5Y15DRAFT_399303 [Xylariaceae sp. FL0016]
MHSVLSAIADVLVDTLAVTVPIMLLYERPLGFWEWLSSSSIATIATFPFLVVVRGSILGSPYESMGRASFWLSSAFEIATIFTATCFVCGMGFLNELGTALPQPPYGVPG